MYMLKIVAVPDRLNWFHFGIRLLSFCGLVETVCKHVFRWRLLLSPFWDNNLKDVALLPPNHIKTEFPDFFSGHYLCQTLSCHWTNVNYVNYLFIYICIIRLSALDK